MNFTEPHNEFGAIDRQSKAFFSKGKFDFAKSKDDVWAELEKQIAKPEKSRQSVAELKILRWVAAASVLLIISAGSFMRLYTTTLLVPAGQHSEAVLPDQSVIRMNAETRVSYHPYWWFVSRNVELEGEAFFEVSKGKNFTVTSSKGSTRVLGTSFNIFAREDIYKVTCITGTVKVKSVQGFEAVIKPNSKAEIDKHGKVTVVNNIEVYPEISWKKSIFMFTTRSVHEVFREIERQYGITIQTQIDESAYYSGNFSKDQSVEEVLAYICPALGLKFVRKADKVYFIQQDE